MSRLIYINIMDVKKIEITLSVPECLYLTFTHKNGYLEISRIKDPVKDCSSLTIKYITNSVGEHSVNRHVFDTCSNENV